MAREEGSEVFWQFICSYQQVWWLLSIFTGVLGLLLVFALLFLESEASFFIAVLDAVIVVLVLTGLLYVLRKCDRRQREF